MTEPKKNDRIFQLSFCFWLSGPAPSSSSSKPHRSVVALDSHETTSKHVKKKEGMLSFCIVFSANHNSQMEQLIHDNNKDIK